MSKRIAKVVFNLGVDKEFDYLVPKGRGVSIGSRVWVEFNRRERVGLVIGVAPKSRRARLNPILEVLDQIPTLTLEHINFIKTLKKQYPFSLGELSFLMIPPPLRRKRRLSSFQCETYGTYKSQITNLKPLCIKGNNILKRLGVYKEKIILVLERGSVIMCFPSVSFLEFAKKMLEKEFGSKIVTLHTDQRDKEILFNWLETRKGRKFILGTRSSLFYYPPDLALIILEEENSPYYFCPQIPYYYLWDVAYLLHKFKKVELILGTDYPSLNVFKMINEKSIDLIEASEAKKPIEILKAKTFIYPRRSTQINPLLEELLAQNLEKDKKILILYNKKGFFSILRCTNCGQTFLCPRCLGYLSFSLKEKKGICFRCSYKEDVSGLCKICHSGYIRMYGVGIERLESRLKGSLKANIDTLDKAGDDTQIILTTYAVLDTPVLLNKKVDVGFILDSDYFLSRIDFEATFRLYIYLRRLSSLVREGVYVFTQTPNHYLWGDINKSWYKFYQREVVLRKEAHLPPFRYFAKITLRAKNKNKLLIKAYRLYNILSQEKLLVVFGPVEEIPLRLGGKYFYSVIVKARNKLLLRKKIKEVIQTFRRGSTKIAVIIR
jgi:primosomal protein N' (replication factor Y)